MREPIEHERVIGVRRMAEGQNALRHTLKANRRPSFVTSNRQPNGGRLAASL
jgi:hypothetical protein